MTNNSLIVKKRYCIIYCICYIKAFRLPKELVGSLTRPSVAPDTFHHLEEWVVPDHTPNSHFVNPQSFSLSLSLSLRNPNRSNNPTGHTRLHRFSPQATDSFTFHRHHFPSHLVPTLFCKFSTYSPNAFVFARLVFDNLGSIKFESGWWIDFFWNVRN